MKDFLRKYLYQVVVKVTMCLHINVVHEKKGLNYTFDVAVAFTKSKNKVIRSVK